MSEGKDLIRSSLLIWDRRRSQQDGFNVQRGGEGEGDRARCAEDLNLNLISRSQFVGGGNQLHGKVMVQNGGMVGVGRSGKTLPWDDSDYEEEDTGLDDGFPDGHRDVFNIRGRRAQAGPPSRDDRDRSASPGLPAVPRPRHRQAIPHCGSRS